MEESNLGDHNRDSCSEDTAAKIQNEECNPQDNVDKQFESSDKGDNCDVPDEEYQSNANKDHGNEKDDEKDRESSTDSNGTATLNLLEQARCSESMPSSDSNKENIDGNSLLSFNSIELDSDYVAQAENSFSEYDNPDQIPLSQLLKMHVKQLVSGFEFGEATKRRAQENMKTARDKKKSESRKSEELTSVVNIEDEPNDSSDLSKPGCSKTLEIEHKTPHSRKRQRLAESKVSAINSDKDFCKATRRVPDCFLDQPDCIEVWVYMVYKEEAALKLRNPRLFNDFKSVTPRMRAILLDWLMEVSAVYHLRRVTYYLSVDYFDRFLSIRPDIPKSLLQLVGITCLYIAAKVEEIYPPNLSEFSYVCDGACKSIDMVSCELLILNSLGWEVVLTTPSDWLNLYMQLHFKSKDVVRTTLNINFNKDFIFPQYSAYEFTRASQLMDLMSLDPGFLKFGYSVIAAAAMYYMYDEEIALSVSGLHWTQLKPCVDYMEVFYKIVGEAPDPRLSSCLGGPHPEELNQPSTGFLQRVQTSSQNENYSFQTHVASMDYFERATIYRLARCARQNIPMNSPEVNSEEGLTDGKPETLDSDRVNPVATNNENDVKGTQELNECLIEDNISSSLVEDLNNLDELTKRESSDTQDQGVSIDQNLMTIDEIFELILSQNESKNSE